MLNEQADENELITVEVRTTHIERAIPSSAANCATARALRDAGFQDVEVSLDCMVLDGVRYDYFDDGLIQWQQDAISGDGMAPIAMQLDSERRSVKFLKTLPWTT